MLLYSVADPVLPLPKMACDGRLDPAGPILQKEMVLLSFPVVAPVLKKIVPPEPVAATVQDPLMLHRVKVLLVASPTNRIVDVPTVAETV